MGFCVKVELSLTSKNEGWTVRSVETNNRTFFRSHFRVLFCLFRQTEQFRGNNVFWQCSVKAWVKGEELWKKIRIEFRHTGEQSAYRFMKLLFERTKSAEGVLFAETTYSICETRLSVDTRVSSLFTPHYINDWYKQGQNIHVNVYGLPVYFTQQYH